MKTVFAVSPYQHPNSINFKNGAFEAWKNLGGKVAQDHYPLRLFHRFVFNHQLPLFGYNKQEARLRFVEPVSLNFDTFPDYIKYEIIPLVWDCWPKFFEFTYNWFLKNRVQTAIFTSSQNAEMMKKILPHLNILFIPEGVNTQLYAKGKNLTDRKIDLLEFGRRNDKVFNVKLPQDFNHLYSKNGNQLFSSNNEFFQALADTKIAINFPRCDTQPEIAGNIETLTQRYWECMLSRIVMIGRAPKELVDLIGYNPVIDIDKSYGEEQVLHILNHIEDYQPLVDKNYETAQNKADWSHRMKEVMNWLRSIGYTI